MHFINLNLKYICIRIAANIIKPRMEMGGLSIEARWCLTGLKRYSFPKV